MTAPSMANSMARSSSSTATGKAKSGVRIMSRKPRIRSEDDGRLSARTHMRALVQGVAGNGLELQPPELGWGTYTAVFPARWHGVPVAAKVVVTDRVAETTYAIAEAEARKYAEVSAQHPHVARVMRLLVDRVPQVLLMELTSAPRSLFTILEQRGALTLHVALQVMIQVASALVHLHSHGVVHGNVKSSNVLVEIIRNENGTPSYHCKLSDYGFLSMKTEIIKHTAYDGGIRWTAPEVVQGFQPTEASDIYGFAMLCSELLTGLIPYYDIPDCYVAFRVINWGLRPELPADCPLPVVEFLAACALEEPMRRPTSQAVLTRLLELSKLYDVTDVPMPPSATLDTVRMLSNKRAASVNSKDSDVGPDARPDPKEVESAPPQPTASAASQSRASWNGNLLGTAAAAAATATAARRSFHARRTASVGPGAGPTAGSTLKAAAYGHESPSITASYDVSRITHVEPAAAADSAQAMLVDFQPSAAAAPPSFGDRISTAIDTGCLSMASLPTLAEAPAAPFAAPSVPAAAVASHVTAGPPSGPQPPPSYLVPASAAKEHPPAPSSPHAQPIMGSSPPTMVFGPPLLPPPPYPGPGPQSLGLAAYLQHTPPAPGTRHQAQQHQHQHYGSELDDDANSMFPKDVHTTYPASTVPAPQRATRRMVSRDVDDSAMDEYGATATATAAPSLATAGAASVGTASAVHTAAAAAASPTAGAQHAAPEGVGRRGLRAAPTSSAAPLPLPKYLAGRTQSHAPDRPTAEKRVARSSASGARAGVSVATAAGGRTTSGSIPRTVMGAARPGTTKRSGEMRAIAQVKGHAEAIQSMVAVDDTLWTASHDATIRVWRQATLEPVAVLKVHSNDVVALTAAGMFVFSASTDRTIRCFRVTDRKYVKKVEVGLEVIHTLAASTNFLFSATAEDTSIRVWRHDLKKAGTLHGHRGYVTAMVVSRELLFSGSCDRDIRVWRLPDLECVAVLKGHRDSVEALVTTKDLLFSCSMDRTVRAWRLSDFGCQVVLQGYTSGVLSLAVQNDMLFSGCEDGNIRVWRMPGFESMPGVRAHREGVTGMFASPAGTLYTCSEDASLKAWKW